MKWAISRRIQQFPYVLANYELDLPYNIVVLDSITVFLTAELITERPPRAILCVGVVYCPKSNSISPSVEQLQAAHGCLPLPVAFTSPHTIGRCAESTLLDGLHNHVTDGISERTYFKIKFLRKNELSIIKDDIK
ncbi:unnamed protein product [Parnassius mnemosyne]|uniref:Uncharacterized protein n=1 Tax=Parnassius mnemosyne TaxID=213953 RepID=A0AAV1KLX1_9NEOP